MRFQALRGVVRFLIYEARMVQGMNTCRFFFRVDHPWGEVGRSNDLRFRGIYSSIILLVIGSGVENCF